MEKIQYSSQVKVLGYIWGNNFSNDPFLDLQITKARRTFYFLMRQLKSTKRETLVKAYKLYCRPIIEYCSPLLEEMTREQKKRVEGLQRNIVAYICHRANMTEKQELEDTINLNQLSYEEEEVYSQHLNTQSQVINTATYNQEHASKEETYDDKLTQLNLALS